MRRQEAENIITEFLPPVFGFALKRCKSVQDAEDLSQEIVLKAFRSLLIKDDVVDPDRFIWTIAHHALSNYYRDAAKSMIGIPLDEVEERIADPQTEIGAGDDAETLRRLQKELAYLSKLQRKIVTAYYFENRKQADIARELRLPVGTVKWHLFEAKKELKRGMDTMRTAGELQYNPIRFHSYGVNGCIGTKSPDEFFRSALSQNICYCVRDTAKTVGEIADELGVSPVYVENEVEFLEEYGFLLAQKKAYIANFLISEPTAELLTLQDRMYRRAAGLFADDLYEELTHSGILEDPGILCRQCDGPVTLSESPRADWNFLLWTLIPYIAACSGEKLMDRNISFDEVATIRPDGGQNIFHATVVPDRLVLPEDYVYMKNWSGPMWNGNGERILWQIDSEWSDRDASRILQYSEDAKRVLSLYAREQEGRLTREEYTWLAERGYIKTNGDYDGQFQSAWQIVILTDKKIQTRLLAIGERIKESYKETFDALKAPYVKAALASVPAHLRKVRAFELQSVFYSDGWFLVHCIAALLRSGKMKEPTPGQKKALTTLIANA